jgi:pimeloyl-ACP methyl ester carboxylesterase
MPSVTVDRLKIEYAESGDHAAPAILLIMGLGMQLTAWPEDLCDGLADRGFRVVRFDNRDVGKSTKIRRPGGLALAAAFARALAGFRVMPPYSLRDMAADALGLMDALGLDQAHIVGVSMGGMIGQIIAAEHAARTLSLTSIMSSSGNPNLPRGDPRVLQALMRPRRWRDREHAIAEAMAFYRLIGSPDFPTGEDELRVKVTRSIDRCYYPAGFAHHILAIMASGSRVDLLRRIRAPALVVHGTDDPLIPVAAGKDTAAHIPGAELKIIRGMGHDLPSGLVPILVEAIAAHCRRAYRRAAENADKPVRSAR